MSDTKSYYRTTDLGRTITPGTHVNTPIISLGLDSVRAYQWEIHLTLPKGVTDNASFPSKFTLAAKQVTAVGFASEPIEVNRVNDKVFYPGKATPEEVTVTFDNFYLENGAVSVILWEWFQQAVYNPMNGQFGNSAGKFKADSASIIHLDAQGAPNYETVLYGVWPISWKTAEFNYGTNEFHTIEMVLRYDFMDHTISTENPKVI